MSHNKDKKVSLVNKQSLPEVPKHPVIVRYHSYRVRGHCLFTVETQHVTSHVFILIKSSSKELLLDSVKLTLVHGCASLISLLNV